MSDEDRKAGDEAIKAFREDSDALLEAVRLSGQWVTIIKADADELHKVTEDRDALLEALRTVEWQAVNGPLDECSYERCTATRSGRHDPDCIVGRALARPR